MTLLNPWECPRCKRINAPFVPACICSPEKDILQRINEEDISRKYPSFSIKCSICSGDHLNGVACMSLGQTFP